LTAPLVSVVVPAFDAADWIAETLSSVVAQTWPRASLEIIVVDDGSSDGTADVASRALRRDDGRGVRLKPDATGEVRLKPDATRDRRSVRLQPDAAGARNRGPSAARNVGWQRARGDWIQFLDADDLLAPEKIARQMAVAAHAPPDVALVVSPWQSLVNRGPEGWQPDGPIVEPAVDDDDVLMSVLRPDGFVATGSQLFRRAWLERVGGYDETCRLVEDVHLLVRIAIAGGRLIAAPAPAPLFWYRRRTGSLSSADPRAFVEAQLRNARLAEAHWRRQDALTANRREFLANLYASAVRGWTVDDPAAFDEIADHILTLQPAFVPAEPPAVHRLARLVGYRQAERTAGRYRRLKARVGRSR
jgi:glycosyltransferase involved in cell wall biosynthesis